MVALTFFGKERFDAKAVHPHESPASMTTPLIVLAVLAVFGGFLGLPPVFHVPFTFWSTGSSRSPRRATQSCMAERLRITCRTRVEWMLLGLGAAIALFFAHRGFHAYAGGTSATSTARPYPDRAEFLENAWRIDSIYHNKIVVPLKLLSFLLATWSSTSSRSTAAVNGRRGAGSARSAAGCAAASTAA